MTISVELQYNWRLTQVVGPDLAKLLFVFAKDYIRGKIQNDTLKEQDELLLLTTTTPDQCPYQIAGLEEPEGARFEVEEIRR